MKKIKNEYNLYTYLVCKLTNHFETVKTENVIFKEQLYIKRSDLSIKLTD